MKKAPKLKKKYADGGPITEYSWDDYYKRLDAWKDAKAQAVPKDIVEYQEKWIVPQIKSAQEQLNAALAAKYNLKPGQAPKTNQQLDRAEAEAAIGKEAYATYLTNVQGYQSYRDKVAGSYKAPSSTVGAFDPTGEQYGPRHFKMFTPTEEQKAANVATTKAAGKPTSQEEANKIAAEPPKVTKTETSVPQDMTPSGGIMIPPGKTAGTTAQPAAQPGETEAQPAAVAPRYDKHITNFGQTYYFVYDAAGKPQQITQQAYDAGIKENPGAQQYVLDESTGLYDEQGNPKQPVLTNPPQQQPVSEVPVVEQKPAPPKLKKGGKVKGYATGGVVPPDSLTGDQLIAFEKLTTDEERQAYLDSIAAGTDGGVAPLTGKQKAIASLAPVGGNLAATGVEMIETDPLNKKQQVAQGAGAGALRGAGTGLALGMNPLLLAATGGLSAPIGAIGGALIGGTVGAKKGKKKFEAARSEADANAQQAAISASYQDSGYAAGGKIVGAGTAKSDDIPARVKKGSFIVPAENAKIAEQLRKQYLGKENGKAKLKQGGNTADVYLSNGEHMFSPDEVAILKKNGIDVDGLAPNSETTGYGYADGGTVKPSKAREILRDGTANGKKLTEKQKRFFGWIAGKGMADGGEVGYKDGGDVGPLTYSQRLEQINARLAELDAAEEAEGEGLPSGTVISSTEWYKNINSEREALKAEKSSLQGQYGIQAGAGKDPQLPDTYTPTATIYTAKTAQTPESSAEARREEAKKRREEGKATTTTPAPKTGGGTGGGGTGAAKVDPNFDTAAYQAAFLKEHGGVGSQDPNAPAVTTAATPAATGTQAVASNPIDPLKKKWQELMDAGKTAEAAEVEKQMKEMGYRYQYDNATKKGDWVSAAGTSTGVTSPISAIGMGALESEDATVDTPTGVKPSPYKRIYETLGPGGLLGATQAGLGLIQAQKAKAPTLAGTQVDAALQGRADQAVQQSRYGLSAAEYSNAANRIESQRANVMRSLTNAAPGDVGAIVGNARQVAIDTNRSRLDLEAANERMRMAKESRADSLVGAVAQQRQQLFAQNMGMFNQQQAASAELINAGLANLVGSITARENQNRIDERAQKYGQVNLTLGGGFGG